MTRIDPTISFLQSGHGAATQSPSALSQARAVTLTDSPASLARLTAGSIIEGTVIGHDARGRTQVRTEHGMISFRTPISLPPGSQLVLQLQTTGSQIQVVILSVTPPGPEGAAGGAQGVAQSSQRPGAPAAGQPGGQPGVPAQPNALLGLIQEWPTLGEALAALQGAGSPAAQILATLVARPNPQISSTLLFFVAALTRGDVSALLGREIGKALVDAGRADLAGRLADDFGQLSRLAAGTDSSEWRVFLLPFADAGRIEQIRLFLKRHRATHEEEDDRPMTRFVFEVGLSRLGRIQFDGLAGGDRFDLMVRSLAPLSDEIMAEIRAIFGNAREAGKLAGEIAFQTVPAFSVAPLEEALASESGFVV